MIDEMLHRLHDSYPDANAAHMYGYVIECIAHKIGLPGYVIPADMIIGHLKYLRRKEAEKTERLDKIRDAVTDDRA